MDDIMDSNLILYMSSHGDGSQHVLINEIDVDEEHSNTLQRVVQKLVAAPMASQLRNSPHTAKCFGPYMNSKVSNCLSIGYLKCNH